LIIALYFIETGVLLIAAPWTAWWHRNFFAEILPWLAPVMGSPVVQWAVVLTGLVTFVGGLREVRGLFVDGRP